MCGIVGYTGHRPAVPILLDGLGKLEYRGYDSAGLALLKPVLTSPLLVGRKGFEASTNQRLTIIKKSGKLVNLVSSVRRDWGGWGKNAPLSLVTAGIGHTRWATHGHPTDENAHPHSDCHGRIAVVHNGIIENYQKLKSRLQSRGHVFKSQTDSEVLAHLIEERLKKHSWVEAVRGSLGQLDGVYSVVAVYNGEPQILIGARSGGGALVVGYGKDENFIASDVPALLVHTRRVCYLEDHELAVISSQTVKVMKVSNGKPVRKALSEIAWSSEQAEKGDIPTLC